MAPGNLNHLVDIGYYTQEEDQWGDPVPGSKPMWNRVARVWASVEGLRGSHYFQAQQNVNQSDHRVKIRYSKDVKPGMIVQHDDREFTIQAVLDEDGKRRWLTLICKEEEPA